MTRDICCSTAQSTSKLFAISCMHGRISRLRSGCQRNPRNAHMNSDTAVLGALLSISRPRRSANAISNSNSRSWMSVTRSSEATYNATRVNFVEVRSTCSSAQRRPEYPSTRSQTRPWVFRTMVKYCSRSADAHNTSHADRRGSPWMQVSLVAATDEAGVKSVLLGDGEQFGNGMNVVNGRSHWFKNDAQGKSVQLHGELIGCKDQQ